MPAWDRNEHAIHGHVIRSVANSYGCAVLIINIMGNSIFVVSFYLVIHKSSLWEETVFLRKEMCGSIWTGRLILLNVDRSCSGTPMSECRTHIILLSYLPFSCNLVSKVHWQYLIFNFNWDFVLAGLFAPLLCDKRKLSMTVLSLAL